MNYIPSLNCLLGLFSVSDPCDNTVSVGFGTDISKIVPSYNSFLQLYERSSAKKTLFDSLFDLYVHTLEYVPSDIQSKFLEFSMSKDYKSATKYTFNAFNIGGISSRVGNFRTFTPYTAGVVLPQKGISITAKRPQNGAKLSVSKAHLYLAQAYPSVDIKIRVGGDIVTLTMTNCIAGANDIMRYLNEIKTLSSFDAISFTIDTSLYNVQDFERTCGCSSTDYNLQTIRGINAQGQNIYTSGKNEPCHGFDVIANYGCDFTSVVCTALSNGNTNIKQVFARYFVWQGYIEARRSGIDTTTAIFQGNDQQIDDVVAVAENEYLMEVKKFVYQMPQILQTYGDYCVKCIGITKGNRV